MVNRKHIQRLMREMGLEAIYQKPHLSEPHPGHKIYPYLLRNVVIDRKDQVWASDITYIPLARGFMYLVAIIDWWSRYVLAWKTSTTLDTAFCLEALEMALSLGNRKYSIATKGLSLPAMPSPQGSRITGLISAWTAGDVAWTTYSRSACGDR